MKKTLYFAQKGLVLDPTKTKILVHRYKNAKYRSAQLSGKLGLPGGRLNFGEQPDDSLIREVEEETGVMVLPFLPFYTWTWIYQREDEEVQIVATARLCTSTNELFHDAVDEPESEIEKSFWLEIDKINLAEFVENERPIIESFLKYKKNNPFVF
jgi:8-oxo-dGTP pyrophosphatase MutT (NUDIX family)